MGGEGRGRDGRSSGMHMLFGLSRHWGAGVPRETGHKRGYTAHTCRGGVCVCVCVCVQETFATWSCFRAGKYSLGKRLVT